jgi:hypothetical protein
LAFTAKGQWLVGCEDGKVAVWEADSRRLLAYRDLTRSLLKSMPAHFRQQHLHPSGRLALGLETGDLIEVDLALLVRSR